jgi:hypothetical protein
MPYEMVGRAEPHKPLFDFDDVSRWVVEGHGVDARLYRTAEQRLWRPYAAKVVYRSDGQTPDGSFILRPREPIVLPADWDCFEVWGWGNGPVEAIFEGADGKRTEIGLGRTDAQYWFLLHAKLGRRPASPARFVGLRFREAGAKQQTTIYVGPGYAFREELKPLHFAPWPRKLPFPTTVDTILPPNDATPFENSVRKAGDAYVFGYSGKDCELRYEYRPTDGTLGDLSVLHAGKRTRPCVGGGVQLATPRGVLAADDPAVTRAFLGARLIKGVLTARWRLSGGGAQTDATYRMRIRGKSLIVEIAAAAPVVRKVALGAAVGLVHPQLFRVPYLTYGGNDPHILYADGLFYFTQFDWYVSNASVLYGGGRIEGDRAAFNGGAEYIARTDGTLNAVHERLFITVSPNVQEVLPTIANPPSPMRSIMADRLWRVKHGENYAAEVAEARRFAAYGMDRIACRYHEEQWRDGDESFTFREHAAPGRGGDRALRDEVAAIKACGWLVGLYCNYTDFAPVNANWNPDRVSRTPDGNYYSSWWRCYAPKPMYAVEAARYYAPRVAKRFGANHSYCDVHTAVPPFSRVDYDARVPGAGTFRRTFECFGRLLYEQKFAFYGPVYSEGGNHWWYAGLVDGNYAQLGSTASWKDPLFVDFDLLRMHPLSMDAGMGEIGMYYRGPLPDLAIERFRAATLAYGHIGYLDYQTYASSWKELIKTYYLQQPLQRHYVMAPVESIRYADDSGRLMPTSQALVTGAYRTNRVRVVYRGGFTIWVNGSPTPWRIPTPRGPVVLPEWGYAAYTKSGSVLSACALGSTEVGAEPTRIEYCLSPSMFFLDSRGSGYQTAGPIGVDGAVALKRRGATWWVIPATEARRISIRLSALGFAGGARPGLKAVTEDGQDAEPPRVETHEGVLHIYPGEHPAFRYELSGWAKR